MIRGEWRSFPNAVGCIDGPPREIYRPEVELQGQFYSSSRHYHLMNTELVVEIYGNIIFLQAGFLGAMNNVGSFILIERIGTGTNYDMPSEVVLLADQGYGDAVPFLTRFHPFYAAQMR